MKSFILGSFLLGGLLFPSIGYSEIETETLLPGRYIADAASPNVRGDQFLIRASSSGVISFAGSYEPTTGFYRTPVTLRQSTRCQFGPSCYTGIGQTAFTNNQYAQGCANRRVSLQFEANMLGRDLIVRILRPYSVLYGCYIQYSGWDQVIFRRGL